MKVVLNDVVDRITGNVDRFNTDLDFYVGGEHYENECIAIYNPGLLKSEKGKILGFKFHFPFKKGDVLFMARNPHLKKASVVFFDGICSDASYVLRTKDSKVLLQEFLILLIQNESFWEFFEKNKSGSVNYLMNWKEMKNYTFNLPSIDIQKKLSDKAWAIENLRKTYSDTINALEESIHSKYNELFPEENTYAKASIKDYFNLQMGKTPSRNNSNYWGEDNKWISISDLGSYYKYTEDTKEYITSRAIKENNMKPTPENTVLMSFKLTIGKTAITSEEVYTNEAIMSFIPKTDKVINDYLRYYLSFKDWNKVAKRAVKGVTLNKETIGKTQIAIPPIEIQEEFSSYVIKTEQLIDDLKKAILDLKQLMKTSVYDYLDKEVGDNNAI